MALEKKPESSGASEPSEAEREQAPMNEVAEAGDTESETATEADASGGSESQSPASVSTSQPASASPAAGHRARRFAPVWLVPLYLASLIVIYVGQRVLSGLEQASLVVTVVGLLLLLFSALAHFSPRFRSRGDRRQIENLMAVLALIGLAGVIVYFGTTEAGLDRLGLAEAELETRERIAGILTVLWVGLITVSTVPMVFAQTALYPMRKAERPESRRVRAAAASGLALALSAIYGSLFVFSAEAVDLKVDYSYFKTSMPSESTRKVAQSLTDNVRIVGFFPEVNEVRNEVEGYLKELAKGIPSLKVEMHDRLMVPALATKLSANQDGTIVLSQGGVKRSLTIGTDLSKSQNKLRTLDRDFQEQLIKLVKSRRSAYFTVGHGELNDSGSRIKKTGNSVRILEKILQKQNYIIRSFGLAQGLAQDVPEDAGVVLVLGPTEPFAPEEIAALKRYAERGGRLLMALDPEASPVHSVGVTSREDPASPEAAPSAEQPEKAGKVAAGAAGDDSEAVRAENPTSVALNQLANIVGLELQTDILANERKHLQRRFNVSDRALLFSSSFSSHASVSTLSRNAPRAAIVVSGAGSLKRHAGPATKVDFTVRTMPGTFADTNHNFMQEKAKEPSSVFQLAAAVTRTITTPQTVEGETLPAEAGAEESKGAGGKPSAGSEKAKRKKKQEQKKKQKKADDKQDEQPELRAFVVADADVFSDWVMERMVGNQVLLVDAIRWLGGEESWAGEVSSEEDVRIEHTKQEDLAWFYATIFGAPMLVLGLGVVTSRRSRRRRGGKS